MEPLPESSDRDWTEPGIYEVSAGVYRIPLPLPNDGCARSTSTRSPTAKKLVLVDSGWALAEARQQLADALAGIGAELGDVSEFLVTHVHRDHYSQAVACGGSSARRSPSARTKSLAEGFAATPTACRWKLRSICCSRPAPAKSSKRWPAMFGTDRRPHGSRSLGSARRVADPGPPPVLPGPRVRRRRHSRAHSRAHVVFVDDTGGPAVLR